MAKLLQLSPTGKSSPLSALLDSNTLDPFGQQVFVALLSKQTGALLPLPNKLHMLVAHAHVFMAGTLRCTTSGKALFSVLYK